MSALDALTPALTQRSGGICELCGAMTSLAPVEVGPSDSPTEDRAVLLCHTCRTQLDGELDAGHLFCLQSAIWSEVPAVQVLCYRLLQKLPEQGWVMDLREQLYLDADQLAWAQAGSGGDDRPATVDSNGTPLADGDSVTLIKDLDVKGAKFTAKRGTMVKNIRLTDDPGLIEGKVNKTAIYLKTEFLKRA